MKIFLYRIENNDKTSQHIYMNTKECEDLVKYAKETGYFHIYEPNITKINNKELIEGYKFFKQYLNERDIRKEIYNFKIYDIVSSSNIQNVLRYLKSQTIKYSSYIDNYVNPEFNKIEIFHSKFEMNTYKENKKNDDKNYWKIV